MSENKTRPMFPYVSIHDDAKIRSRTTEPEISTDVVIEFRTADYDAVLDLYLDVKAARKVQRLIGDALIMHASKAVDRALDELEAEARS